MTYRNWMVCQILIIIATPLHGQITAPDCVQGDTAKLENEVFEISGFHFWAPCDYKFVADAEAFCSNAGGWQHEPKTEEIVERLKQDLDNGFYQQGLKKMNGVWKWIQGGQWDGENPTRKVLDDDDNANTCSEYENLIWQGKDCAMHKRRYICQFPTCNGDVDCNKYQDCVTSDHDSSMKFCICKDGHSGTNCTDGDYCDVYDGTCENGGTCQSEQSAPYFACMCAPGYYGPKCTENYCTAKGNPCNNGGTCQGIQQDPFYECQCSPGWYGPICQETYCTAKGNPCDNGGTCQGIQQDPFYECQCSPGWYGPICQVGYCEKFGNPCQNGGTCVSNFMSTNYECDCTVEYTGTNCIDPLYHGNGDCLYHINMITTRNYDVARQTCHEFNGELAMVKNASIQEFLDETINRMYVNSAVELWIGGENNDTWIWLDGEMIPTDDTEHDNWADDEPKNYHESVLMKGVSGEYLWYGESQNYDKGGIICEKPDDTSPPCAEDRGSCVNGMCQAIGCQTVCICEKGYFQRYCNADLITISSPDKLIGVDNEDLIVPLEILTFDGNVTIAVTKNGISEGSITDVSNGTTAYSITNVKKSDSEGTYTFSASSDAGGYSRITTTSVTVHVRAYVHALGTTSIYAPQSDTQGCTKTVTCTVGGIPHPTEYGWYRNGEKLKDSSDLGVYQSFEDTNSTLHVKNATSADRGEYQCNAANTVADEKNTSFAETSVTLSVYSEPSEVNPTGKPCSAEGEIEVQWVPGIDTNDVDHSFRIFAPNSTVHEGASQTANNGAKVTFAGLEPDTQYEILVDVCPEPQCCITKLSKIGLATTGHGLPGDVSAQMNGNGTSVCEVSWSLPSSSVDQIEGYNVSWIAKIRSQLSYAVDDIKDQAYVAAPQLNYSIETKPNKVYEVEVSARTCAGNGNYIAATGECWTAIDGPDDVPNPVIDSSQDRLRQETRRVYIEMPDEANGGISCLLVILYKFKIGKLPRSFSDLKRLSSNSLSGQVDEGYIAAALPRSSLEVNENIPVTLGNGAFTSCDASRTLTKSNAQTNNSYNLESINIALDYKGVEYGILSVTTTRGSQREIIVTYSKSFTTIDDLPAFIQGQELAWVAACVLVPLGVMAVIAAGFIYYKRKSMHELDAKKDNLSLSVYDDIENESIYEKIDEHENTTVIPVHTLKEYYVSMKSDDDLRFRNQFKELQQRTKRISKLSIQGSQSEVMIKSRDRNIVPYDTNRVCIKGQGPDSYINASYIKGSDKMFIATQGPLRNTIIDFWRMVVEQACTMIVMLTKCEENGRRQCERYWPASNCEVRYGDYRITNEDERVSDGIVMTKLQVKVNGQNGIAVTHYLYQRWPENSTPHTTSSFLRLHRHVTNQFNKTDKRPIVVHCSSGAGRAGVFIGFDLLSDKSASSVDIYDCVLEMRKQRVDMVQTIEQYEMLHQLMVEHYHFGEKDVDRSKLLQKYSSETIKEFQLLKESESFNLKIRQDHSPGQINMVFAENCEEDWAAIDATAIEAYQGNVALIASRGPSTRTTEYFLRALWDNNVDEVFMLNNPSQEAKNIDVDFCEYWPKKPNTTISYNSISITLQSEHEIKNTVERTLLLHRRNRHDRIIKQIQYLGWKIEMLPEHGDEVIEIIKHIIGFDQESTATILVHCTDGLRRSGIFIAVVNLLARLQSENRIDVFRTVKDLRDIRPGMIPTQIDYMCCYDLAKNFLSKPNEYANHAIVQKDQQNKLTDAVYHII